jgi:hypothetical protein
MSVAELLRKDQRIWRCGEIRPQRQEGRLASGHEALDQRLGGGWPAGLIEIFGREQGGAMTLLIPTLARLTDARAILLVSPPRTPYGPGYSYHGIDPRRLLWVAAGGRKETLWALERAAASAACALVIGWIDGCKSAEARRLQLAAKRGDCRCFLLPERAAMANPSPAALRLAVTAAADHLRVDLLKYQGMKPGQGLRLAFSRVC